MHEILQKYKVPTPPLIMERFNASVVQKVLTIDYVGAARCLCPAYLLIPDHRIKINVQALWGVDPHQVSQNFELARFGKCLRRL
jgi:hypothetical protein